MKFEKKISNIMKKKFNSELIYSKKYLKAEKNLITKKSAQKECSQYIYISVILIDSVYIKDNNYYPQVFLEKCKHVGRKKEVTFCY